MPLVHRPPHLVACVVLLLNGCGGKSAVDSQNGSVNATGGLPVGASSGGASSSAFASGGSTETTALVTGGGVTGTLLASNTFVASGGAYGSSIAGAGGTAFISGGVTGIGTGGVTLIGAGGSSVAAGGASSPLNCTTVTCPVIPTSCKKLVQAPDACCPTCLDTGCQPCATLACATGTHSETVPGDCCPSCVADPPDACTLAQNSYATQRAGMLEKYGSTACNNSSDCTLLLEDNTCAYVCNIALPTATASFFTSNVRNGACSACPAPARYACEPQVPACLNGKCVAAAIPVH